MACEKAHGREAVVARSTRAAKTLDPGFRRDDEVGGFAGMTKSRALAGMTK
jgi:hypothetical protein